MIRVFEIIEAMVWPVAFWVLVFAMQLGPLADDPLSNRSLGALLVGLFLLTRATRAETGEGL